MVAIANAMVVARPEDPSLGSDGSLARMTDRLIARVSLFAFFTGLIEGRVSPVLHDGARIQQQGKYVQGDADYRDQVREIQAPHTPQLRGQSPHAGSELAAERASRLIAADELLAFRAEYGWQGLTCCPQIKMIGTFF